MLKDKEKERYRAIGNGINDASILTTADIGITMGSGTDVAMETGNIVLIKDDLRDAISSIDFSSYTTRKMKQGLFWAFSIIQLSFLLLLAFYIPSLVSY